MSIGIRKLLLAGVIIGILALANVGAIVTCLQAIGIVPLAIRIRSEYLTGTTLAVAAALLILLPGRSVWAICVRRCPVCDSLQLRKGKYCAECGSRV